MSYAIDRAIEQGYESACHHRKDGESPYHDRHPMFKFWWEAVVMKSDIRDYGLSRVMAEVKKKRRRVR